MRDTHPMAADLDPAYGGELGHLHDPFDPARYSPWLETLGHRPLPDGRCLHRWKNRETHAVRCPFLDGFRAALAAPTEAAAEAKVVRLSRADLELIEAEASTAHDYIWGTAPLTFKEPVTKEQASAAVWSIHNLVRAALATSTEEPQ